MEKSYTLGILEDEEFKSMVNCLPKDQKVQQLCIKYYTQFRKNQTSIQSDKIALYLKCAYYLAQKSQWITSINGEKIRNAGLSLNQLLKKNSLQDIMITLKQYSKRISLQDPQTLDQLQKLIKEISFLITFYNKFQKVLLKLQLKDKNVNKQYSQTLSEMVWLLYIEAKNKILQRSLQLIDNTCMLAHTLCFALIYSWDYYQPGYFLKNENNLKNINNRKEINARIHEKILQLFLIKNIQSYKNVAQRFQAYFSYLKKVNVIRMTQGKQNFLSPQFLFNNYKRLDQFYQKKLDYNHLDQRIFFKDRTSNITPSKFTPFARQKVNGTMKKLGGNIGGLTDRSNPSFRILNYENMEAQVQDMNIVDVPPTQIKFPKNIIQTPLSMNTPLIQQTPYTTGILMYNYVNDLSSRFQKIKFTSRKSDQIIFQLLDQVMDQSIKDQNVKSRQIKRNHIFSVYKLVAEQFCNMYPNDIENQETMKAILLISIEIVFFVSNIDVSFQRLQNLMNICQLTLWRGVDFFLKFDKKMPANIKVHLLDLEVQLISQKIWKNSDVIAKIQIFLSNQKLSSRQQQSIYQKLCKRILHQIAFQILNLCKNTFDNKQDQQKVSEISFDIMKQVLLKYPQMIWQNHFDQIIMCSVFSVCRAYKLTVKFQNIRDAYLNCNSHLTDQKKLDMFTNIEYQAENNEAEGASKGIIGFYNSCFLVVMNQSVKHKCLNYGVSNTGRVSSQRVMQEKDMNSLLQSPLSGIIPKQINCGLKKIIPMQNNGKNPQNKIENRTSWLHAYNQSPLLKNQIIAIKPPAASKKALNYDQPQRMPPLSDPMQKKDSLNQTCKIYQQNCQTNNYLTRKFTTTKPTKLGAQNSSSSTSLIKSPCNNTKSPRGQNSPSPRVMNDTLVKDNHNIYYTKRQFNNGKPVLNLNLNR